MSQRRSDDDGRRQPARGGAQACQKAVYGYATHLTKQESCCSMPTRRGGRLRCSFRNRAKLAGRDGAAGSCEGGISKGLGQRRLSLIKVRAARLAGGCVQAVVYLGYVLLGGGGGRRQGVDERPSAYPDGDSWLRLPRLIGCAPARSFQGWPVIIRQRRSWSSPTRAFHWLSDFSVGEMTETSLLLCASRFHPRLLFASCNAAAIFRPHTHPGPTRVTREAHDRARDLPYRSGQPAK